MDKLFLIDAIAPFFRGYHKLRINWSKIPFGHLQTSGLAADEQWQSIREESENFGKRVRSMGYNAVSIEVIFYQQFLQRLGEKHFPADDAEEAIEHAPQESAALVSLAKRYL